MRNTSSKNDTEIQKMIYYKTHKKIMENVGISYLTILNFG